MKLLRWFIGILLFIAASAALVMAPGGIYLKWFYALLLACFIALIRLYRGPTPADRAAAIKVVSVLIISFGAVLSVVTSRDIYLDIALAWSVQAFIGTMALAKYLEGRSFDD